MNNSFSRDIVTKKTNTSLKKEKCMFLKQLNLLYDIKEYL